MFFLIFLSLSDSKEIRTGIIPYLPLTGNRRTTFKELTCELFPAQDMMKHMMMKN